MSRTPRLLVATLSVAALLLFHAGRSRADIIDPTYNAGASSNDNTDTGLGFDPTNLTNNGGLSTPVNTGDSLATGQAATMVHISFSDYWETNSNGGNYYDGNPPPVLVWDLGANQLVDNLLLWQNIENNDNGLQGFSLRFSTDGAGPNFSGAAAYANTLAYNFGDPTPAQTFALSGVTARYVEMTLDSNYFGLTSVGGDRVGFGKIRFDARAVPEPGSLALLGIGGLGMARVLVRRRKGKASA